MGGTITTNIIITSPWLTRSKRAIAQPSDCVSSLSPAATSMGNFSMSFRAPWLAVYSQPALRHETGPLASLGLCQSRLLQGQRREWRPKLAPARRRQPISPFEGLWLS